MGGGEEQREGRKEGQEGEVGRVGTREEGRDWGK